MLVANSKPEGSPPERHPSLRARSEDTMAHRILIVDDEGNHRRSLSISLRMEGFEVLEAADGQHALDTLKRESVDIVVADLMMPRVDGLELARRLRFAYPRTKMILMSAYHL